MFMRLVIVYKNCLSIRNMRNIENVFHKALLFKTQNLINFVAASKYFSTSFLNSRSITVNLSYLKFEPEKQVHSVPLIILHGLLGSKQNWKGLGKAIARKSGRQVYALDARNHGDSPHSVDFSYVLMAADVKHFMNSQNIPKAVVMGHSMGGRTAMRLALTEKNLLTKLIVVDVSPVKMPDSSSSVIPGFISAMKEAITTVPELGIVQARRVIDSYLSKSVEDVGIRQFLLTNLAEKGNSVTWKPNLDILLEKFYSEITEFPPSSGYFPEETLFICGEKSPYVKPSDFPDIKVLFPKAEFVVIPDAGHWVHSERPSEFLEAVSNFL